MQGAAARALFASKGRELFCGEAAGADQAPQGAFSHFLVIRDGERGHLAFFDEDHVAAALPHHLPAVLGENLDDFSPVECG